MTRTALKLSAILASAGLLLLSLTEDSSIFLTVFQVAQLMKMIKTLHEHKRKQERLAMRERAAQHQKQQAHVEASRAVKRKERAKHAFFLLGQAEKRQNQDT